VYDLKGSDHERGLTYAPTRRAGEREAERASERKPEEVVRDKLLDARKPVAAIIAESIPKLESAHATGGDRRSARERRAAYDLAAERIEAQFTSACRRQSSTMPSAVSTMIRASALPSARPSVHRGEEGKDE
jgi:hypothetical protein